MSFPLPERVAANRQKRAEANRPHPCGEGVGRGLTCGMYPTHPYPRGWRCETHKPGGAA